MLDFGKFWLIVPGDWGTKFRKKIEYKRCIEFNDYSLKILMLVMISAKISMITSQRQHLLFENVPCDETEVPVQFQLKNIVIKGY